MELNRRKFLQQFGYLLTAVGGSALSAPPGWAAPQLDAVLQKLGAQGNQRKLALLVGVDRYPHQPALAGCKTDVEMQGELLTQRLGFAASDVLTLCDRQASREAIETAFTEHLIQQAKPGDTVVFHFSGYGTQVHLPDATGQSRWVNALLPHDGDSVKGLSNCVLEQTLLLLVRLLKTRQSTLILDTAYRSLGQTWQGCWRSRSNPDLTVLQPSQVELAVAQQLQLNRPRKFANETPDWSNLPASLITSQDAIEGHWLGFSAGLLTAALTQWLWAVTEPTTRILTLTNLEDALTPFSPEKPCIQPLATGPLPYTQNPTTPWGADGYLLSRSDAQTATVQMTGLSGDLWTSYGLRSQFQVLNAQGEPKATVELRSKSQRQGKISRVSGELDLVAQQWVQERVRCLPRNLGLAIGLDRSLQRIERVDATSVLASVPVVSSVGVVNDQPVDYLFAKRSLGKPITVTTPRADSPSMGYGLFSAGGQPIPKTVGGADEAVIVAINRITPTFNTLMSLKWWRLLVNETTTQLSAQVSLNAIARDTPPESESPLVLHYSQRCLALPAIATNPNLTTDAVPLGSRLRFSLTNPNDFPLYALILAIDGRGVAKAFAGQELPLTKPHLKVDAQSTLNLPVATPNTKNGIVVRSPGFTQVWVLFSRSPWDKTTQILSQDPHTEDNRNKMVELKSPLRLTQAVLEDLHQASLTWENLTNLPADHYALHTQVWAGFRITYQAA